MAKADLKEYREQLRQEFSSMLWGKPSQLPGSVSKRVAVGAVDGAGADADVGSNVQAFQTEFLRNLVADAMEELRDEIHHDIQSLHVDMLRQFHTFHMELQSYLTHYADMNRELVMKVKHLEEENKRLKKHF
ncbi:hypothetical protein C0Q70_15450 [Pomacea canaliculata]|uniref:Uncharacterized protein n=1 Tax=Pomacea canaliculata TaxID=400727 RepID=A0A2T7NUX6_POMCA|nr:hypothetical protein C0Q70_15450 [Pomacea canaliculata]